MSTPRLADQIYGEIVRVIADQDLQIGDRLPSEARLAEMFAVSRTVVREALVRLESDGLTEARRGAGSFVTRRPSALLANHIPLQQMPAALGTYEVRFVLEAEAARLAAIRHSAAEMAAISDRMDDLRHALLSEDCADAADMALHRAIMIATGNLAFVTTFDSLADDLRQVMKAGVDISRSRPAEAVHAMLCEHQDIVDAIRLRDGERASLAMRWHLSQGRRRLMP